MTPDYREPAREKMEQAQLGELMPGFNKEDEWEALSSRLKQHKKKKIEFTWVRAAAVFVLLLGGAWLAWFLTKEQSVQPVAAIQTQAPAPVASEPLKDNSTTEAAPTAVKNEGATGAEQPGIKKETSEIAIATKNAPGKKGFIAARVQKNNKGNTERFFNYYMANEFVCNGTQCPIEICIVQTFKCQNAKPSAVATCNTLAPDEAKQLRYKAVDKKGNDCKVTVDEIRIKRVSTGETIVLNSNSKPSTAEELFECMTGAQKCSILAGIFDADCNNHCKRDNITIHNTQGDLILQ